MILGPLLPLLVAATFVAPAISLTPAGWRAQSIYQVMTDRFARTDLSTTATCDASQGVYCGGTWKGLISKLDYIQGMGFTAIWISPFVEQMSGDTTDGSSYHGYWAQNIYAVNSAFGTSSDLVALSAALHSRGMYLMLDVVTNHYAWNGCSSCVDYSVFDPFNSKSYFHDPCSINYDNQTSIQVCWQGDEVVSLPDLRTEDSDVLNTFNSWIKDVVATYNIDGIRLDSAKHVDDAFLPSFEDASGVYIVGEVFNGDPTYVIPYQQYLSGLINYPTYYWITRAFQSTSGSISDLANGINTMKSQATDLSLYGSFLENHDNVRFPSLTSDMSLAKSAIAFTMLMDGIPIIYEGQEQHYQGGDTPNNREAIWLSGYDTSAELYKWITNLNAIRKLAISKDSTYLDYSAWPIYTDSHTIAMRKGYTGYQIVGVYSNVGSSASTTVTLTAANTGFTAGQALTDVMSCTSFTAGSSGDLAVTISGGVPRVFYPTAALSGSGICGGGSPAPTTTTSAAGCTATSVPVTFNELVTTSYGTTIKLSGSVAALGSWDTSKAIALDASQYTSANPLWYATVNLAPSSVVQYKFLKVAGSSVTWEADPNHTLTVPCSATTVASSWQS
ncbi:glycosylhydrolase family 13-2 [Diaporthe amygdali]|uniref:glycosylhydrolase family 13-2 n=1 Tax=Phomopsis amygdali TaxID=1214568 RepID=UPI0022FDE40A|nr:glycosylhydrolase family 13-2 [Diaporthe amygdali]KAJ0121021.1 glycosylhydrolase family 13-2 [Diaporthe amygdali]